MRKVLKKPFVRPTLREEARLTDITLVTGPTEEDDPFSYAMIITG